LSLFSLPFCYRHGFGLPHTDESFWNRDLGNCLDYTMNPSGNMHPDIGNFEFLEALYGNTNGNGNSASNGNSTGGGNLGDDASAQPQSSSSSSSGANRRNSEGEVGGEIPSWVRSAWDSVSHEFSDYYDGDGGTASENHGWRLLRRHGNLRTHQLDIGGGYSIVVHAILADGYENRVRRRREV
jgi:hypothetical protein